MKCPHCTVTIHDNWQVNHHFREDDGTQYRISSQFCPNCKRLMILFQQVVYYVGDHEDILMEQYVLPKNISRTPVPPEVSEEYAQDYREACLVFADSPKASAALTRRCLQNIIHNKLNIRKANLYQEIEEVITRGLLPSDLAEALDAVRHIGNFAAHPIKSEHTGEVVAVEPQEAEWNLEVIESLFEYLFVRPAALQKKRDALNEKLTAAGKTPMK